MYDIDRLEQEGKLLDNLNAQNNAGIRPNDGDRILLNYINNTPDNDAGIALESIRDNITTGLTNLYKATMKAIRAVIKWFGELIDKVIGAFTTKEKTEKVKKAVDMTKGTKPVDNPAEAIKEKKEEVKKEVKQAEAKVKTAKQEKAKPKVIKEAEQKVAKLKVVKKKIEKAVKAIDSNLYNMSRFKGFFAKSISWRSDSGHDRLISVGDMTPKRLSEHCVACANNPVVLSKINDRLDSVLIPVIKSLVEVAKLPDDDKLFRGIGDLRTFSDAKGIQKAARRLPNKIYGVNDGEYVAGFNLESDSLGAKIIRDATNPCPLLSETDAKNIQKAYKGIGDISKKVLKTKKQQDKVIGFLLKELDKTGGYDNEKATYMRTPINSVVSALQVVGAITKSLVDAVNEGVDLLQVSAVLAKTLDTK